MTESNAQLSAKFLGISACFLVDDVIKSADYYRDVMDFHFDRYWGEPPCFVIVIRGKAEISLVKSRRYRHYRP